MPAKNHTEPTIVTAVSGPAPPHIPPAHCTSEDIASSRSGSSIFVSEEMVLNNENTKETIPIFCVMTQSLGPFGGATANIGILNGVASAISTAPAMTQQGQPGSNNSAEANMSLSHQQTLASSSAQSGFVQIWEGNLSLVRWGEPEHISRLQGWCKRSSASESLAANFPQTLQIHCLVRKALVNELVRQHTGKADVLSFWAIDRHAILNYMQEMNIGGLISLASKTLFVYLSDKTNRLIGLILPHKYVPVMQTTPDQQLLAQPPHQLQQLQGQPLYQGQQLQDQGLSQVQQFPQVQQLQEQPLSQVQQLQEQPLSQAEKLQAQLIPDADWDDDDFQALQQAQLTLEPNWDDDDFQALQQAQLTPEPNWDDDDFQALQQAQLTPEPNWDDDDFQELRSFFDD